MKAYSKWGISFLLCLSMVVNAQTEDAFVGSLDYGFCMGKAKNVIIAKMENEFFATIIYDGQDNLPHTKGVLIKHEKIEYKHLQLLYESLENEINFGKIVNIQGTDSKNRFIVSWDSEPDYEKLVIVTYANGRFTKQPFTIEGLDVILSEGKSTTYARKTEPSWDKSREFQTISNEWEMLPRGLDQAQMDEIAKSMATNLGNNTPNYIVKIEVIGSDSLVVTCSDNKRVLFSKKKNEWILKCDKSWYVN